METNLRKVLVIDCIQSDLQERINYLLKETEKNVSFVFNTPVVYMKEEFTMVMLLVEVYEHKATNNVTSIPFNHY